MNIERLPVELFVLIRDFLFCARYLSLNPEQQHSKWCWQNFLSMSRSHEWRTIRKFTMIWSFGNLPMEKYINDDLFRKYIDAHVLFPNQLFLRLSYRYETDLDTDMNSFSQVGNLEIDCYPLEVFPSLANVCTLSLGACGRLRHVGNYPNLTTISLVGCPNLRFVGKMENLKHLSLTDCTETNTTLLGLFPLECLISLKLSCSSEEFFVAVHRLKQLKKLDLTGCNELCLPPLGLSSLEELTLSDFQSIDLSGLTSLKTLTLSRILNNDLIRGTDAVFPNLTSLSYVTLAFFMDNYRSFPSLKYLHFYIPNIIDDYDSRDETELATSKLTFDNVQHMPSMLLGFGKGTLRVDTSVKQMDIWGPDIKGFTGVVLDKYFNEICLSTMPITDISMFCNVEKVILRSCSFVESI
jgi:hypothetical protein